jgi:hypothetical protein
MGLNNNPSQPAYLIPGLPSAMGATRVVATDASGNLAAYTVSGTGTEVALTASPVFSTDITVNGARAGRGAGNVSSNTAFGPSALNSNTTGSSNTAVGQNALLANTTGLHNTAIGAAALTTQQTAQGNTAYGFSSLNQNTTGNFNGAFGYGCLFWNTTGDGNLAFGLNALVGNPVGSTGSFNVALGYSALQSYTTGGTNVGVGLQAGQSITTGSANTFLGTNAGNAVTTGANNVIIGAYTGSAAPVSATGSNYIVFSDGSANVRGYFDNTGVMRINNLAGVGSRAVNADANGDLSAASDSRLKREVPDAKIPGLEEILQLKPRAYKWLKDIEQRGDKAAVEIGFFANDVAPIIPSAAPKGQDGYYGFYDRSVTAALVKALQDLNEKFEAYVATHP